MIWRKCERAESEKPLFNVIRQYFGVVETVNEQIDSEMYITYIPLNLFYKIEVYLLVEYIKFWVTSASFFFFLDTNHNGLALTIGSFDDLIQDRCMWCVVVALLLVQVVCLL